jgi:hypothetical protein
MNNQEILITILVVVLVIFKFYKFVENFESNDFPCTSNPMNSNCTCPSDAPSQRVIGKFPMNYGQTSPYLYSCVSNSVAEPNTNVYPNPPE